MSVLFSVLSLDLDLSLFLYIFLSGVPFAKLLLLFGTVLRNDPVHVVDPVANDPVFVLFIILELELLILF